MSFRVENPLIVVIGRDLIRGLAGLDEIAVLQNLGEEKALLLVEVVSMIWCVNVAQTSEPNADGAGRVDPKERVPGPVLILGLARGAPGVVVTLDDFRSEIVVLGTVNKPESRRVIE